MRNFAAATLLLLLLLAALTVTKYSAKELEVDEHGRFVNFVVSVHSTVSENWVLVEQIKSALTSLSQQLAIATKPLLPGNATRGLSLGEVRILVPKHWANDSLIDRPARWEQHSKAHVQLHHSSDQSDRSFSYQPDGCGRPGRFIYLPISSLANASDVSAVGRLLLQHFSQLVYGVYPEIPTGSHFYDENGSVRPVTCTRNLKGDFRHSVTGEKCSNPNIWNPDDENCKFVPHSNQEATASIMATHSVPSVQHYCMPGNHSNSDLHHDSRSPTLHNKMCNRRSVGEVIRGSAAFAAMPTGFSSEAPSERTSFLTVREETFRRYVFVIDVSGSMSIYNEAPFRNLKRALRTLLKELENGTEISMVSFSSTVIVLKPLTKLNPQVRSELISVVENLKAGGGTAIGDAVAKAMEILGTNLTNPNESNSGYLLLLSDGGENVVRFHNLTTATEIAQQTSIIGDTISLGSKTDPRMKNLSDATSGISCFVPNTESGQNLLTECISTMLASRLTGTDIPIQLYSNPVSKGFSIPIKIDKSANAGAKFSLQAWQQSQIANWNIKVASPSGRLFNRSSRPSEPNRPTYTRDGVLGVVTLELSDAIEEGVWTVSEDTATTRSRALRPPALAVVSSPVSLMVSTKASVEEPFVLEGFVSDSLVELRNDTRLLVTGSIFRGSRPQAQAEIFASVESDEGVNARFLLRDNGADPDAVANDGIHSGFVPLSNITRLQEYSVRVLSVKPVDRVATAGKFTVTKVDTGSLATTPPARVTDLSVRYLPASRTAEVSFTAVGDQQNVGTAGRYELLASTNSSDIERSNTSSSQRIPVTVTPLTAGSRQIVNVTEADLPVNGTSAFVAVFALSSKNIASPVSNIISIQFADPMTTTQAPTPTTDKAGSTNSASACVAGGLVAMVMAARSVL